MSKTVNGNQRSRSLTIKQWNVPRYGTVVPRSSVCEYRSCSSVVPLRTPLRARYGRYDITRRKTNQTIDGRFSCTRRGHSKISAVITFLQANWLCARTSTFYCAKEIRGVSVAYIVSLYTLQPTLSIV